MKSPFFDHFLLPVHSDPLVAYMFEKVLVRAQAEPGGIAILINIFSGSLIEFKAGNNRKLLDTKQ